jgi:hypothetical protein
MSAHLRRRAKGLIAAATAVLTAAQTLFGPNEPKLSIVLAALGAFGVYFVENEHMPTGTHRLDEEADRGQ